MWNEFKCISLSYERAPLEVRERFHLDGAAAERFTAELANILGIEEVLVVSTCNRTEIYYHHPADHHETLIKLLCIEKGLALTLEIQDYFEVIADNRAAVTRLFEVSIGLHSQVVGDLQISGQVKQSYSISAGLKLAGPFLHRLMHTIFHANKRVQQETAFRDGAASLSYVAAELAASVADGFASPRVLVLGAGEMGRDVARNLDREVFKTVMIVNRSPEKSLLLAGEIGADTMPLSALAAAIAASDVVICAVEAPQPLLNAAALDQSPEFKPLFIIDLSMPRAVSPEAEHHKGVVVYDLDDLRARSNEALDKRLAAVPAVKAILQEEMDNFLSWSRELTISPVIQQLRDALEQIRKEEMARHLRNAGAFETDLVDKVTKGMIDKIVKLPVLQLKAACQRGEAENLIGVLQDLFDLEKSKTHS